MRRILSRTHRRNIMLITQHRNLFGKLIYPTIHRRLWDIKKAAPSSAAAANKKCFRPRLRMSRDSHNEATEESCFDNLNEVIRLILKKFLATRATQTSEHFAQWGKHFRKVQKSENSFRPFLKTAPRVKTNHKFATQSRLFIFIAFPRFLLYKLRLFFNRF